jgi:UPF0755 protein
MPDWLTRRIRWILGAVALLVVAAGLTAAWVVFGPNTQDYAGTRSVKVPPGAGLTAVADSLEARNILAARWTLTLFGAATGWGEQAKAGHYTIAAGASNYAILDKIRRGLQTPLRITIPPGTRPDVVAKVVGRKLRFDAPAFEAALRDTALARELGTDPAHLFGYMLPETYEFYWQAPPERVVRRAKAAFDQLWTEELAAGADSLGLSRGEVATLASIVEREALRDTEKPRIAGVYLNRLQQGWRLDADPTVIYAVVDRGGERPRRVLNKHLRIDHPYNTYRRRGLPPGPITNPSPSSLRAVVEAEDHSYMFFAADGTGGHRFSRTLREHNRAAEAYHDWYEKQQRLKRQREAQQNAEQDGDQQGGGTQGDGSRR